MNNDVTDIFAKQLKLFCEHAGRETPDEFFGDLPKEDRDAFQEVWGTFHDDVVQGGLEGFSKHYNVKAVQSDEDEVGVLHLEPRNQIAGAVVLAWQKTMGNQAGISMREIEPRKKEFEEIELTPEICRDIEFNV